MNRDALGDRNGELDLGINCLDDCRLCEGRRNEDNRNIGTGGSHCFLDGSEYWKGLASNINALASLAWVHATDDVRATSKHASGVLHALGTGHALDDDL